MAYSDKYDFWRNVYCASDSLPSIHQLLIDRMTLTIFHIHRVRYKFIYMKHVAAQLLFFSTEATYVVTPLYVKGSP